MKEFISFLTEYKELLIVVLSLIVSVLCLVLKRRPKVVDNSISARLIEWIIQAEKLFSTPSDKMNYVLLQASKYLGDDFVESDVREAVEYILSSPEKKVHK